MTPAAFQRYRKRLLELKAEILAEGDSRLSRAAYDVIAVGSDEDAQPLTEMSQTIASSRNRNRSGVLARVGPRWRAWTPIPRRSACAPSARRRSRPSGWT